MTQLTTYQPKFLRGGRPLSRLEAIGLIISGCAVTVAVHYEDLVGMADLRVTITAGTDSAAGNCAYVSLSASARLDAADMQVYAAVMAAAASLCNDVNAAFLANAL